MHTSKEEVGCQQFDVDVGWPKGGGKFEHRQSNRLRALKSTPCAMQHCEIACKQRRRRVCVSAGFWPHPSHLGLKVTMAGSPAALHFASIALRGGSGSCRSKSLRKSRRSSTTSAPTDLASSIS